jgi:hypothetical protein
VPKTNNISPDARLTYLLEVNIAYQKKLDEKLDRLNERFDWIEEYVGMSDREKNKPDNFYNTKEVMEILRVSRNTLKNYRDKGVITGTKPGKKVLYTAQEINRIKE